MTATSRSVESILCTAALHRFMTATFVPMLATNVPRLGERADALAVQVLVRPSSRVCSSYVF